MGKEGQRGYDGRINYLPALTGPAANPRPYAKNILFVEEKGRETTPHHRSRPLFFFLRASSVPGLHPQKRNPSPSLSTVTISAPPRRAATHPPRLLLRHGVSIRRFPGLDGGRGRGDGFRAPGEHPRGTAPRAGTTVLVNKPIPPLVMWFLL